MYLLISVFVLTESQLLSSDAFESPELNLVRLVDVLILMIPSVVLDSESDRICFVALLFL